MTRLASYWYHAHDAAKALPAVLDASVEARRRHAYSEQLGLLERAMELWDAVPDAVRAALRPVAYTEAYPPPPPQRRGTPPGAPRNGDPEAAGAVPLHYLDLLAEAAVAGRLCGERERAMKITKRALRVLDEEPDPLRAAWFWVQRSRLAQSLARGDGWSELGTAQDLVRGLPPSEVHAEVLASAANWSMLHEPGPEAMAAAERAVEYARMVGAHDIELNARLTLGGLKVDAGDIDAGLAEMYEVKERATELGVDPVVGRSHINLPSALEGIGRSQEAAALLREGLRVTRELGLLDSEGWVWGNLAETLHSLGHWDEAAEAAAGAHHLEQSAKPRAGAWVCLAGLALDRGETAEAGRHLRAARASFGTHDSMPQHFLPMAGVALGTAAAEGRLTDARTELLTALAAFASGFPPGTQRYGWPLLLAAATAEADAYGDPATEPDRPTILGHLRAAARTLTTGVPLWRAYEVWLRAELLRAEGGRNRRSGPRPSPPWNSWSGPTTSPGSASGSPRHCSPRERARTSVPAPRNCSGCPEPSPSVSGRSRWPGRPACWPSAPASPGPRHGQAGPGPRRSGRRPRSHRQGTRRAAPGGRRPHQPPYRRGAVHLAEDGQRPRVQHPRQARSLRARRGGGGRPPAGTVHGPGREPVRGGIMGGTPTRPWKGERCSTPSRNCSLQAASTPGTSRTASN